MDGSGTQGAVVERPVGDMRGFIDETAARLLADCANLYFEPLLDAVHTSVSATNDLFDWSPDVPAGAIAEFRAGRARWLDAFEQALRLAYAQCRMGNPRVARRPDAEAAGSGIRLLEASEQEAQIALLRAVRRLHRVTQLEVRALDARVAALLGEAPGDGLSSPFSPPYVLDAIGSVARAVYRPSRIWRPLMERVVGDLTPFLYRTYVAQNRLLADRGVLPDIKARLRSRSAFRPAADRELVAAYRRLQSAASTHAAVARPVRASELELAAPWKPPSAQPAPRTPSIVAAAARAGDAQAALRDAIVAAEVRAAIACVVEKASARQIPVPDEWPVGPVARERSLEALVSIMQVLGRQDLSAEIGAAMARRADARIAPAQWTMHVGPALRAALAPRIPTPDHRAAFDLAGALLDTMEQDPLLAPLGGVLARLHLPVLQAVLIDGSFFADAGHPARRVLNALADAAIAAAEDPDYHARLVAVAGEVASHAATTDDVRSAFAGAVRTIDAFVADERRRTARALAGDVAAAAAAGARDLARSQARNAITGRLTGRDVPAQVREFAETVWVRYLGAIIRQGGTETAEAAAALRTLDDLLWSVSGTVRRTERRRLVERIPTLVGELRRACALSGLAPEKAGEFLQQIYALQSAALEALERPRARAAVTRARPETRDEVPEGPPEPGARDVAVEMVVRSWVRFRSGGKAALLCLWWASPTRDHYVFAGRGEGRGRVLTQDELVRAVESGAAVVVLDPIPAVDRAIDAVFDAVGRSASRNFRYASPAGNAFDAA